MNPFQSIFSQGEQERGFIFPRKTFSQGIRDSSIPFQFADDWDVAIHFHEIRSKVSRDELKAFRKISAQAVLREAKKLIVAVTHSSQRMTEPLCSFSEDIGNLDLDTTLEESILKIAHNKIFEPQDLWVTRWKKKQQPIVLSVDTSLSMTGEKLILTAVALAVVILEFSDHPIGLIAFENEAWVIKDPKERISVFQLIERFLDVPAQGYTHLEEGILAALRMQGEIRKNSTRPPTTILLSDGKYTAGKDPSYLSSRFDSLKVIKMGSEKSSLFLCQELSRKGNGDLFEVRDFKDLPKIMYTLIKDLLRGI